MTIDSVGRPVFGDLALAPGADGERRFGRAGRYRFTAAGRDGAVIVRAPAPSPSPGGGGSGSPRPGGAGCDRRTVYRYDITVKGRKSVRETWRPEFRNLGGFSISYTHIVTYPGVRLGVTEDCGGRTTLDLPAGGAETAPGTGSLLGYAWSDSVRSAESGRPPSCAFATAVTGLGAQVEVGGFTSRGVGGAFVSSRLTATQLGVLESILSAKHGRVCNKDPGLSNTGVFDGLPGYDASAGAIFSRDFTVPGGALGTVNTALHGCFSERRQGNPAMARRLARGQSFSVTPTRVVDDTSSQTTAHGTASISLRHR